MKQKLGDGSLVELLPEGIYNHHGLHRALGSCEHKSHTPFTPKLSRAVRYHSGRSGWKWKRAHSRELSAVGRPKDNPGALGTSPVSKTA